ncbi:MAG: mechanosensitive ion channel family protein [archaeon]|nr:mechanosensitive ion channel family protein [archaeon]
MQLPSVSSHEIMTKVSPNERRYSRLIGYAIGFVILLIVVGVLLYFALYKYNILPISSNVLVEDAVAAVLGLVIIFFLGKEIELVSSRLFGPKRGNMIFVVFRFVAYIVLGLVLLAIAGASPTALLAGGTFAGLVLGLAAQTVLSNIIAGVMIILARPYEVGDRITFFTWQYGLIVPAYPPKFYSHETLMPGYSGLVQDIGLAYTKMQLDDGPSIKVPNSVMVQAAVVSHELKQRWVRSKYDIPNIIDPNEAIPALTEALKKNQWVVNPDAIKILVNAMTSTIYVISIDALCKGNMEEEPRSSILIDVSQVVNKLIEKHEMEQAANQAKG